MEILPFLQAILPYLLGILALAAYQDGGIMAALPSLFATLSVLAYRAGGFCASDDMVHTGVWLLSGLFCSAFIYCLQKKCRIAAKTSKFKAVLERNGMILHTYQPPISTHGELEEALYFFSNSGHIIFDRDGKVVGRFLLTDIKDIK